MLTDRLSTLHFNQRVTFDSPAVFSLAGEIIDTQTAALLTGALDGSTIKLELQYPENDSTQSALSAVLTVKHDYFARDAVYQLAQTDTGYTWLAIDYVVLKKQHANKGLGIRMFAQQAFTADRLGIHQISLRAVGTGRNGIYNGAYTWARFGFLPMMDEANKQEFEHRFPGVASLTDLMSTEQGRLRWRNECFTLSMYFEPGDNTCWETFVRYMAEKGVTYA